MNSKQSNRRQFLKEGSAAALAGLAVVSIRSPAGRGQTPGLETPEGGAKDDVAYGERSRFEKSVRVPKFQLQGKKGWDNHVLLNPLQDQRGIITPSGLHHFGANGHLPPDIDPQQHRLLIHGMVDRPLIFTMDELMRMPSVSRIHFVECHNNGIPSDPGSRATVQFTHGKSGCSEYTGVLLSVLLQETGVQKGGSWVVAEGADVAKLTSSMPIQKAMDDTLVAYGQNGEALRPEQGYPVRLVAPGWEGSKNVKWLRRLRVTDQPCMEIMESVTYTHLHPDGKARWFEPEMGPKSVITYPSGGHRLPGPGYYRITGLAWSGAGVVRRVEASTDGGRTWKDAQLQEPVHRKAFARFGFDWHWNGEEVILQSRCTDELDHVQPSLAELNKLWGVSPDYWESTVSKANGHFNAIEPWRVGHDGSVHNALL